MTPTEEPRKSDQLSPDQVLKLRAACRGTSGPGCRCDDYTACLHYNGLMPNESAFTGCCCTEESQ